MNHLRLFVAGACLAIVSPAIAKQCPSGQILRVSKGVCVNKADAEKAGIIVGRQGKATRVAHAAGSARNEKAIGAQASRRPSDEELADAAAPSPETSRIPKSSAPQPLGFAPPPLETASRAPSPFGGLSFSGLTR